MSQAENYSASRATVDGVEIIRLSDARHNTEVSILPSAGNLAYEMKVHGANVFWWPYKSPADFKAKPGFAGNPFLAPWANRLDEDAFYANGRRYRLNPDLGNVRRDQNSHPIHGLLSYVPWEVTALGADAGQAWVTSKLDFWRHPDWMAQFPFAHNLVMTHRLRDGVLEVHVKIESQASEPMPVSIGFHPYFHVSDAPRDAWTVHSSARDHVKLSDELLPTGEMERSKLSDPHPLRGSQVDDVFTTLDRDDEGRATFWVKGANQKISVIYGPKYQVAVIYAPPGRDFICFEPMTAITNGMNLAHRGLYPALQFIPPLGSWEESFWIRTDGF